MDLGTIFEMPRRRSRPGIAAVALIAAASALPLTASADIYQYVDRDGTIHFTNSRPAPGAKVYMRTAAPRTPAGGALPFAPQDRDPARYTRYDEYIRQAAALYQIPEQLVRAVIKVESDYDPRAVSYAGARGLMQLMPDTAERLGVKDINDPRENIFGGVRYLRVLANTFNGDLELTIAAYNAGEQAVMTHGGIPPFAQTRDYVVKVTKFYRRYRTIPDAVEASVGAEPVVAAAAPNVQTARVAGAPTAPAPAPTVVNAP